jgi:DNA-binding NtrC family response regulator
MLMLDRYLVAGGRALDLATGAPIRWHLSRATRRAPPTLFTVRGRTWLIDLDVKGRCRVEVWERIPDSGSAACSGSSAPAGSIAADTLNAFHAALADARDGRPRALDLAEPSTPAWLCTWRVLAREARLAGFVPIAADALGAVLSEARWRWPSWLKDRSLVVFATDGRLAQDAALALFRLATRDIRPHLVVRAVTVRSAWPTRVAPLPLLVHESPPASLLAGHHPERSPEALVERAQSLQAEGRLVDAEAAARWALLLAPDGAAPSTARCVLARSLLGQGRVLEARAALQPVEGGEAEALRAELLQATRAPQPHPALTDVFLEVLRICQDVEDASLALLRVTAVLRDRLSATDVAFVAREAGELRVLAHAGPTAPDRHDMAVAARVVDTGVSVPPCEAPGPVHAAFPVRYGAAVVGALWCRWAADMGVAPDDVTPLAGLAAAAAAPAAHVMVEQVHAAPEVAEAVPELVGPSEAMHQVRLAVIRAAASPFPVLIEGESGSGKELAARAIHGASARRGRRFSALNCAALPDELVEAELFGHTRGAFTGAVAERVGLFEEAQSGTLFLDEVAELGARVQAKLLRVLQEAEIRRLGESVVRRVDARIVAATNRSLAAEVDAGRFRPDLRYRLDVLRISIPPLRERLEDVPALVRHLWRRLAAQTGCRAVLSPAAMKVLGAYDWPGNVREMQNVLASVMVAGPSKGIIGPQGLPAQIARAVRFTGPSATLAEARRAFEARYVRAALARADGRTPLAARELGVSRQGLKKLLARLGLDSSANVSKAPRVP